MTEFTYRILSSISQEEITQYFHAICQKSERENIILCAECKITIGKPRSKPLGHFTIWHTPIHFSGSKASVLHHVELFRLNFLALEDNFSICKKRSYRKFYFLRDVCHLTLKPFFKSWESGLAW